MTTPAALRTGAPVLLFDRSARLRMQFTGPKAAESLTGLVTNDVLALCGGDGEYACALTPKGRVIADVRILAIAGDDGTVQSLLVDSNAAAGVGFAAMIRKYVNPRLARYADISSTTACVTVVGAGAASLLRSLADAADAIDAVVAGPAFTHRVTGVGGVSTRVVRVPDLGSDDVFDLHTDRESHDALLATLSAAGVSLSTDDEWQRRRVLAGRPEWGIDMDEGTLAQEANMDALQAISYKKGCYTGQETVARVHFRGHVNRTLRRIEFADAVIPPKETALLGADGSTMGDTRSVAASNSGGLAGIAMLRREVPDAAVLTWVSADSAVHPVTVIGAADEG